MPGSAQIGNLAVNLTLETAAFQKGATIAERRAVSMGQKFSGAAKSFGGFASALGIGIGVGALVGITKSAFDMASALDESAQKMGVTVEALQHLNLAAEQSGISQESLAGAMAKLNKNMGLLQQGSPQAAAAFATIGLAAEDLKNKSPEQALGIIADRLNKLPSVQERVAVGAKLMGRGFSELLPLINLGSEGLDKYAEKSRAMGEISTADAKKLDELSDAWDRLKIRIGVATANIIASLAREADQTDKDLANWYKWRDGVYSAVGDLATKAVAAIERMVSGIASAVGNRLNAIWESAKAKVESVKQAFANMYDAVVGHSYVPDMVDEIGVHIGRLDAEMVTPAQDAAAGFMQAFSQIKLQAIDMFAQGVAGAITGTKKLSDAFADMAKSIIADLIQMTVKFLIFRTISGIFGGGGGISAPNFGAEVPISLPSAAPLPGLASGGTIKGFGGVDKNLLSLNGSPLAKLSNGEQFKVEPANENSSRHIIVELRSEMLRAEIAAGADVQIVSRYPAMKADTVRTIREGARRR